MFSGWFGFFFIIVLVQKKKREKSKDLPLCDIPDRPTKCEIS